MNNAAVVGCRQSPSRLQRIVNSLSNRDRAGGKTLTQRLALQQLSNQVRCAPVFFAKAVNRENVGMIERRSYPGFLLKAAQPLGIRGQLVGQQLDRNFTSQAVVPGAIDFAHSSRTKRRQNFAVTELRSSSDRHRSSNYIRNASAARLCQMR